MRGTAVPNPIPGSRTAAGLGRSEAGLHPTKGKSGHAGSAERRQGEGSGAQVAETAAPLALCPHYCSPSSSRTWMPPASTAPQHPRSNAAAAARAQRAAGTAAAMLPRSAALPEGVKPLLRTLRGAAPTGEARGPALWWESGSSPYSELCQALTRLKCGFTCSFYVPEMSSNPGCCGRHGEGIMQSWHRAMLAERSSFRAPRGAEGREQREREQ